MPMRTYAYIFIGILCGTTWLVLLFFNFHEEEIVPYLGCLVAVMLMTPFSLCSHYAAHLASRGIKKYYLRFLRISGAILFAIAGCLLIISNLPTVVNNTYLPSFIAVFCFYLGVSNFSNLFFELIENSPLH